jgi:hypothetical protein
LGVTGVRFAQSPAWELPGLASISAIARTAGRTAANAASIVHVSILMRSSLRLVFAFGLVPRGLYWSV